MSGRMKVYLSVGSTYCNRLPTYVCRVALESCKSVTEGSMSAATKLVICVVSKRVTSKLVFETLISVMYVFRVAHVIVEWSI